MRLGAISAHVAFILALQFASGYAYIEARAPQQSISLEPKPVETDHVRLSTPVVQAWRQIPVGSPVYVLDDVVRAKDWLERALIQNIQVQTGKWHIWIEPGY